MPQPIVTPALGSAPMARSPGRPTARDLQAEQRSFRPLAAAARVAAGRADRPPMWRARSTQTVMPETTSRAASKPRPSSSARPASSVYRLALVPGSSKRK